MQYERTELLCPTCRYDVTQTLEDRFLVCPECGTPITEDSCQRLVSRLPGRMRWFAYATWALTPVAVGLVIATGGNFAWIVPAALGLMYFGWWRIEWWLEPPGAWARAIGNTLATLMLLVLPAGVLLLGSILLLSRL